MRVIVTRPAAQAVGWVERLRDAGHDAVALPLIEIADAGDPAPVRAAWDRLAERRLVVFVSPNAAERFMAARPAGMTWPAGTRAGSSGPGTSQSLLERGVPAACLVEPPADAPQFDSEALWARLVGEDWQGARVLIVRGDGGREWLADTLRARGAVVEHVAAYRRCVPTLDGERRAVLARALAAPQGHLWLFSSSEAIDNLDASAGPGTDWTRSRAVATHERIAERARRLGFSQVTLARPSLAAVSACIQSMAT
ncbi:MAG TPA: uroporphyrinogen-III synthase [Burkholderiaceae bacterium]|nr:uroporphyrinogen-III synthase [Burkholderiaceae bacterium]